MSQYSFIRGDIYSQNCVTGDKDYLYTRIKESMGKARKIDIIVAFLMESGVRLLTEDFREAVNRGAALRLLCGNYLNITQPQALYLLKGELGGNVDLRFYNVPNKSFHPKAYIFEHAEGGEIFVGSSNISRSALTEGIEWNYRIDADMSPEDYTYFRQSFERLFLNESIIVDDYEMKKYSKNWRRPKVFIDLENLEDGSLKGRNLGLTKAAEPGSAYAVYPGEDMDECLIIEYPRPIGPQIEALYELNRSRAEGWDKGIVVAATGVGKTFLAAFDSKGFDKILFVAHREEILLQAESTYGCVRPESSRGYFCGNRKDRDCDILFATVQSLGRKEYLSSEYFADDEFDYIVIDEFHHAAAESYKNIIEYFRPKFLLGLTATPERLDNRDVFALCDYNLIYEARLKEAINKGWLVSFRYYGIFDETDYNSIDFRNGKYDEKKLEQALNIDSRADLILQHYSKYKSRRALGFCSGRRHACFMAEYFVGRGIKACAVISGSIADGDNGAMNRKDALEKLKTAEISIIFSVDMFNEGLDIPEIDMVMFLRPTESPTVFLQQLGRGLRRTGSKKYVNVLDFIGNYKKANLIPFLLLGDAEGSPGKTGAMHIPDENDYPEGCFIDFDLRLIDLFKRMADDQRTISDKILAEYARIKEDIGEKPLRQSMYTYLDEAIYSMIRTKKELNIFRDYISFLDKTGESSEDEKRLAGTKAHDFLKEMESTGMSKLYKMPLLLAFYNNGHIRLGISEDDIYESFRDFYSKSSNAIDLHRDNNTKGYKDWGKREYVNLARKNPMHFFKQSSPGFFYEKGSEFFLSPSLGEFIDNPAFVVHFKDIIDYRTRKFYKERLEYRLNCESNPSSEENNR